MPSPRPARTGPPPERRPLLGAPVRGWALAGWALLPLRAFLGATFLYAGLQKLANPNFFRWSSPVSIHAQLAAAARVSPIHALVGHLVSLATPIGLVISLAELAVGLGTLFGLWTRVAALGGALLALSLFLTVSFHASPYYTGADIVFLFAWAPLIVAGSGSTLSLDGWVARRTAQRAGVADPAIVAIPFAQVQSMCGHFKSGNCTARAGRPCEAGLCPVLIGPRASLAGREGLDSLDRRRLVVGASTAALVGTGGLVLGGAVAELGRLIGATPPPAGSNQLGGGAPAPSGSGPSSSAGTLLGPAKDVPVGNAASFTIPKSGDPGIVVQPRSGIFYAYDAVCPHAGCTVGYYAQSQILACPCHGSTFSLETGQVLGGPAPHGLTKLDVVEQPNGDLYLK